MFQARLLRRTATVSLALGLALGLAACSTTRESSVVAAPAKNSGLSGDAPVGLVDLAAHKMPGSMADYDLRARLLTLAPGGGAAVHPHAGRPGIVLVVKGMVIEGRGNDQRVLRTGEHWQETAETSHWFTNPSNSETAQLWAVDIVPKKK
ncbi:cupin domain-containing protein [Ottowia sp. GY511]|uniref:Cupin domain-containing protein n=1 Tax=Ottowia flava TaxID=2675430 RepID=A0ABW4KX72_9BURK|nr:cupin domain-containing protein [Ottowia sp. GY511]TXK22408.1 cupin domain-containing protein [Ottowia sp. GY511]